MELYKVLIKPSAVKEIKAIATKKDRQSIIQKIKKTIQQPPASRMPETDW